MDLYARQGSVARVVGVKSLADERPEGDQRGKSGAAVLVSYAAEDLGDPQLGEIRLEGSGQRVRQFLMQLFGGISDTIIVRHPCLLCLEVLVIHTSSATGGMFY